MRWRIIDDHRLLECSQLSGKRLDIFVNYVYRCISINYLTGISLRLLPFLS